MRYTFCPDCGKKLVPREAGDDGNVPYCEGCEKYWFDSFHSCVIVLTYNEFDEIVLARQGYLSDKYATITSGYIAPGETAEACALREVKEELGLELESLTYAGTHWFGPKDMLMHGFIGFAHKQELKLSVEVDSAQWVPKEEAPKFMFPDSPHNAAMAVYRRYLELRDQNAGSCK